MESEEIFGSVVAQKREVQLPYISFTLSRYVSTLYPEKLETLLLYMMKYQLVHTIPTKERIQIYPVGRIFLLCCGAIWVQNLPEPKIIRPCLKRIEINI